MSTSKLEAVLAEVRALTPEERQQVRQLLDSLHQGQETHKSQEADSGESGAKDEILQILLKKGLIHHIPARRPDAQLEDWKPVEVKGKPLSEIILEERR